MKLFDETSSIFLLDSFKNATSLQNLSWQRQKRKTSARLPQFSKLTTSKRKEFCKTSFKNGKISAALTPSCQCVLQFFRSTYLKYCACHEKWLPCHTKCCTFHAKSSEQTYTSDTPKCNPCQEISAMTSQPLPWTCLLYRACHGKYVFADHLQISHACNVFSKCCKTRMFCSLLTRSTIPCACPATRHPNPWCFWHFDLEMCFAPQRRALFRHRNLQKVVRGWCVL